MIEVELKAIPNKSFLRNFHDPKLLSKAYPDAQLFYMGMEHQRNHYFRDSFTFSHLAKLSDKLPKSIVVDLIEFLSKATKPVSLRTRETDNRWIQLIFKTSINSDTSDNGTERVEFELSSTHFLPEIRSLKELDNIVTGLLGIDYLSCWQRQRHAYRSKNNTHTSIDFNTGYGYVIEVEALCETEASIPVAKPILYELLNIFGCKELDQEYLAKMYKAYNENWNVFYKNFKTFYDFPEYNYLLESQTDYVSSIA